MIVSLVAEDGRRRRPGLERCRETAHRWLLPPLGATPHQWLAEGGVEVDLMRLAGGGRGRWWPATPASPPRA